MAEKAGAGRDPSIAEITAILRRMEETLQALVALEQRELALEHPALAEPTAATKEQAAGAAVRTATMTATMAPATTGPASATALGGAGSPPVKLDQLTDDQLHERVDKLDRAIARSRMMLMRRYVEAEKALGVVTPRRGPTPRRAEPKHAQPRHAQKPTAEATDPTRPKQTKRRRRSRGRRQASRARAPNRTSRISRARSTGSRRSTSRTCRRSSWTALTVPRPRSGCAA